MNLVILESPYAGDMERNVRYARACLLDSLQRGEAPIAPHLLYPQVLDDKDPDQRKLGIEAGLAWSKASLIREGKILFDEAGDAKIADHSMPVFYTDLGWSPGMLAALELYDREGRTHEERRIEWDEDDGSSPFLDVIRSIRWYAETIEAHAMKLEQATTPERARSLTEQIVADMGLMAKRMADAWSAWSRRVP
jgi:hypothetical protein